MNVIIADDHPLILVGLKLVLEKNFPNIHVNTAVNVTQLEHYLSQRAIDVLVQDIKFGEVDVRDFMGDLRKRYPKLKVVALSSLSDSTSIQMAISRGFEGYVIKSESNSELLDAIEMVITGKKYLSPLAQNNVLSNTIRSRNHCFNLLRERSAP